MPALPHRCWSSWLATLGVVSGVTLLAALGCSSPGKQPSDEAVGSVRSALTLDGPEVKLTGSGVLNEFYGEALALSGDRAVVTARGTKLVYVYERQGNGTWSSSTLAGGSDPDEFYAEPGSVDVAGDTIVVGFNSYCTAGVSCAAGYVYERQGNGTWPRGTLQTDSSPPAYFGNPRVAVYGTRALVGTFEDSCPAGNYCGSVYVFDRQGNGSWLQTARLRPATRVANHAFGLAVALHGDRALVGARGEACADGINCGAVYLFERQANGSWTEIKLTPNVRVAMQNFGNAVALDGDRAVVGTSNNCATDDCKNAYVFERQANGSWPQVTKLKGSDITGYGGVGQTLAISGDTILMSGYTRPTLQTAEKFGGYLFRRSLAGSWVEEGKLLPGEAGATFGGSFDLSGTRAIGGATSFVCNSAQSCGAAFVYDRDAVNGWPQPTDGSSCKNPADCNSGYCVEGICCNAACTDLGQSCLSFYTNQPDGLCVAVPNGSPCSRGCGSGYCSDNVCCSAECAGASDSCLAAQTGLPTGTCGPVVLGTTCSGNATCASNHCVDGVCCDAACAGTNESCVTVETGLSNGTCGPVQNGRPCSNNTQCGSGQCFDGFCCDMACGGTCESCLGSRTGGQNGQCLPIPLGQDPQNECGVLGAGQCQTSGTCNGNRGCGSQEGEDCGTASCAAGALGVTPSPQCSSEGLCVPRGLEDCGTYKCVNAACLQTCSLDVDCESPNTCIGGACRQASGNGLACDVDDECVSGHCVEGVCCGAACSGACESCLAERNGLTDGQCGAIEAGGSPKVASACTQSGGVCGADGKCDGEGSCRSAAPSGIACGSACTEGSEQTRECDGFGACATVSVASCLPYRCVPGGQTCASKCSADADCAAGAVCNRDTKECAVTDATCRDTSTVLSPDGSETDCSPYLCAAGVCRDTCSTSNDCASGFSCEVNVCRIDDDGAGGDATKPGSVQVRNDKGCGCRMAGAPGAGGVAPFGLLLGALCALRWRRRGQGVLLFALAGLAGCKKDVSATINRAPEGNNDSVLVDCSKAEQPDTHAGPAMVAVGRTDDSCVWIDATEVTSDHLAEFARAPAEEQDAAFPSGCDSEPPAAGDFTGGNLPAVGVTWCTAAAYCAWAGKRLCDAGEIDSEWRTVCTDGDHEGFRYDELAEPGACQVDDEAPAEVGSLADCATPTGVLDLVGNAREWTGACQGTAPAGSCVVRGGSFLDSGSAVGCDAKKSVDRGTTAADLGFRCCADVP